MLAADHIYNRARLRGLRLLSFRGQRPVETEHSRFGDLPRAARAYVLAAAVPLATVAALLVVHRGATQHEQVVFVALAAAAAIAQFFPVFTPQNTSYQTSVVFVLAGVLLLPVQLAALVPLIQHLPEWRRVRSRWFVQWFNIGNHTIDVLAAWVVAHAVVAHPVGTPAQQCVVSGLAGCMVYVALNHGLLAGMLRAAHGHDVRATGLFGVQALSIDFALCSLGVVLAALWQQSVLLALFAVIPLVAIQRVFSIPRLTEATRIDAKTGLFNVRHLDSVLDDELARAVRFNRPLSFLMADLDLLRETNNRYGHLAGDAVLASVAGVFQSELRDYDVAARFGGEEFAILLPETDSLQACAIAERIRRAVEERPIVISGADRPVRATISIGVATFPRDAGSSEELLHAADSAMYQAKDDGRNRVVEARKLRAIVAS